MFKLRLIAITYAILLLSASFASAQAADSQLTGTVAYRERIALPPDAVIDVQLLDTSIADVAAQTVADILINADGRQVPVPFTLTYDPAKIVPGNRYSVRATIRSGDGMLMFSSTQAYPVLTHGAPSKVNLLLHTVGHGTKPGVSAKKQATPTGSEGAASASQSVPPPTSESAPPANEPAPSATINAQESEKPTAEAGNKPASAQAASAPGEAPGPATAAETTPPPAATVPPTPAATEQPTAAAAEGESSSRESNPVEPPPTTPEPATPAPEAKAAEPETPLPEAPSSSKHLEATPETDDNTAGSAPARPALTKAETPLADTQWKLIQLGGQDVVIKPPQKPVTLAFSPEGRRIGGSAGCNSYLGTFSDNQGLLHLNPANMTMMVCADPAASREKKFVAMLRSADGYKISGGSLLLTSNGKIIAKFKTNSPL